MKTSNLLKMSLMGAVSISAMMGMAGNASAQDGSYEDEVIATGVKASLERALDRKQDADSFRDSIVAEDIGKFPDQNVAESLQRITGVSISRTNGEGSQLTIRGFGPEFNLVKVNGRTLTSALPGRDFDFQVISSDLITGADIIKTSTAKTPEGSVGALVDLRTARPLDSSGLNMTAALRGRYNDLADKLTPEGSFIVSNTTEDGKFGAVLGLSYQEAKNRIDQTGGVRSSIFDASGRTDVINPTANGLVRHSGRQEFSLIQEDRERFGVNAAIQFEVGDNVTVAFDGLFTAFDRFEERFGFQLPNQNGNFDNLVVSDSGTLLAADVGLNSPQRLDVLQVEEGSSSDTYAIGFNADAEYEGFGWNADLHFSRSDADLLRSDFVPQLGTGGGSDLGSYSFDYRNGDVPNVTSTIPVNDPSSVRAHWNQVQEDNIEDELFEARFDLRKDIEFGAVKSFEFGAFYTDRTKTLDHHEIPSTVFCTNTCGSGVPLSSSIFGLTDADDFLSNEEGNFPRQFVFIRDFDAYFDAISALNGVPGFQNPVFVPRASSSTDETTFGGFAQLNLSGNFSSVPFKGNIGARVVQTDTSASGFSQFVTSVERADPNNLIATALATTFSDEVAVSVDNEYFNFLPSANFSFDVKDDVIVRVAAAKTITRPTITDLSVAESFQTSNIETFSVTSGNPLLEPYEVNQFDLGVEYYGEDNGSVSATFYYKDINTFISEATVLEDSGFDIVSHGDLQQARTAQQNRKGGRVLGFELAATHYLDYVSALDGFGIQANYTFADAEDKNAPPVALALVQEPTIPIEGFAPHSFNLIGFYDKGPLQARLAYNWRDQFLLSRQGARSFGLPEYVESFGQLDFSASYDITDNITASVEGINLGNQRTLRTEDIRERVSLVQYSGRRFLFGLRANF